MSNVSVKSMITVFFIILILALAGGYYATIQSGSKIKGEVWSIYKRDLTQLNLYNKVRENYSLGEKLLIKAFFLKDPRLLKQAKTYLNTINKLISADISNLNISVKEKQRLYKLLSDINGQFKTSYSLVLSSSVNQNDLEKFDRLTSQINKEIDKIINNRFKTVKHSI